VRRHRKALHGYGERQEGQGGLSASVFDLDLEAEQEEAPGLAVRVEIEGFVDPALQGLIDDEVEAALVIELVAPDRAAQQGAELGLQPLRRKLRLHRRIVALVIDEHRDIGAVALVAGAGMGDAAQRYAAGHVSMISMRGCTSARSM
jgi:hypothetical protein